MLDLLAIAAISFLLGVIGLLGYALYVMGYKYQIVLSNYKADFMMMYMLMTDIRGMFSEMEKESKDEVEAPSNPGIA